MWATCQSGMSLFQHTAARRRLAITLIKTDVVDFVSTHSRPKAAGDGDAVLILSIDVSTHSRPKAAGFETFLAVFYLLCFNTQPPEGGWAPSIDGNPTPFVVSTHSRPKAAGCVLNACLIQQVGFNTQPPEGGWAAI